MKILLTLFLCIITLSANTLDDINGTIRGHIRVIHVLHGLDNGYDPETGSTVGVNLRYLTPKYLNFYGAVGFHFVGDTQLTDFDQNSNGSYKKKIASGLFLTKDYSSKAVIDEVWLAYEFGKSLFKFGRKHPSVSANSQMSNPIALFQISQVKNFYESYTFKTEEIDNTGIALTQITKMMLGTRATTDYALIGEYTNTAGVAINPKDIRGEFISIDKLALGIDTDHNTNGITMLSIVNNSIDNVKLQLWNYYADDILNFLNLHAEYNYDFSPKIKAIVKFQYVREDDVGRSLYAKLNANLYGALATLKYNNSNISIAVNKSDGEIFNPWGFDPAFTSSIFSRNAYRDDVSAYKVAFKHSFSKQINVSLSYANYGKSKSNGGNPARTLTPTRDADEFDFVATYKPHKGFLLKFLNSRRTSEYETSSSNKKQNQFRIIAQYSF
ncbi:MAG: hypothetical protein COB07_10225 [Sulfurovum sp.]|nr:MAG: hypothetical protein COB07_10225 [Sulfurovum sp.]